MGKEEFKFERLNVYQDGVRFTVSIYQLTKLFPKEELYGLTTQLRRAAISVVSNICEGSNGGAMDFSRYLKIARGSLFECVGQLKLSGSWATWILSIIQIYIKRALNSPKYSYLSKTL